MIHKYIDFRISLIVLSLAFSAQADSDAKEKVKLENFTAAVESFESSRSLVKAESVLNFANTPAEKAKAFTLLAEVYFAKGEIPKALLYSLLSLTKDPEGPSHKRALFYIQQAIGEEKIPLGSKQELLDWLNQAMDNTINPRRFRNLFDLAAVAGLLPEFSVKDSKVLASGPAKPLQLCLAFDENYAPHAAVTMLSAMLSAEPSTHYHFTVLEDADSPVSAKSKHKLYSLVNMMGRERFSLHFRSITSEMLPDAIRYKEWSWPRIVFFKLLIPSLFTKADRVIWLDSDLIVRKDLSPLFAASMQGNWLQGTRDICADKYLKQQGLSPDLSYVNCGVLLMDTQAMRRDHSEGIFHEAFVDDPGLVDRLIFPEQDLIATIYKGRIQEVGSQTVMKPEAVSANSEWNWFAQKHPSTKWQNINQHFASIIHMESGDIKPWKKGGSLIWWSMYPKKANGIQNLYWALRDMGPWPVSYTKSN